MPEEPVIQTSPAETLSDVVRRAILEAAELRDIEERAKAGEKSRLAPQILTEEEGGPIT